MISWNSRVRFLFLLLAVAPLALHAQDTTQQRGVRIGLTYQAGTRPGVYVVPVRGDFGDSVRAMLQRDFDFSDRVEVVGRDGSGVADTVFAASAGKINYTIWKSLGAAAIVQATVTASGLHVALHDVAAGSVMSVQDFPIAQLRGSGEWRFAVHGVADEVLRWISGTRGIAQSRVVYARGSALHVADSDGGNDRTIASGGRMMSPAWHPSGRYVAYSTLGDRGWQIVVRDLQSGTSRALGATPRGLNMTPAWSPDGNSIVYAHGEENGTDLYVADAFGSGAPRRVTVGRGTDNVSPTFRGDGQRLAFTSGRAGHPEIYTVDLDGSNAELLTPYNFGDESYRSNPDWSPDGRLIAYQSRIGGRFQVLALSVRDRSVRQLTNEGENEDPSWAPDNRHLVFASSRSGARELWVLDVETGRARQLTHGGARLPAWSRVLDHAP
ncbi:MAG: hypothetical protein ABJD07_05785 [Gemmatimonadaceae bacterium]